MSILKVTDWNTSKTWDIPLVYIKEVSLLSNIYEDTGETTISIRSPLFEHVYRYLVEDNIDFFKDLPVIELITLFKYTDYLNFERMQDAIGYTIAHRMEKMFPEELLNISSMF
jgi:hypothetical protein